MGCLWIFNRGFTCLFSNCSKVCGYRFILKGEDIYSMNTEKGEGYQKIAYDFIPLDFRLVSYYILPGSSYLRYAWGQNSLDGRYSDVSYDSLVYFISYVSF